MARTLRPHVVDAHLLPADDEALALRLDLRAVRAARPLLDRLDRDERSRVAAVVVSADAVAEHEARALCERIAGALLLGSRLSLPWASGLFSAFHLAGALLSSSPGERVLLVSMEATVAAFMLACEGGVSCQPLPPTVVDCASEDACSAQGAALASSLTRGRVRARELVRVVNPGLSRVEGAAVARHAGLSHVVTASMRLHAAALGSAETLLAAAALAPPPRPILLWRRGSADVLEACVLRAG